MDVKNNLDDVIKEWTYRKSIRDAREEYPKLISRFGGTAFISALASDCWSNQRIVLERIPIENDKFCHNTSVRTIGVYYFRMRNGGIERVLSILLPMLLELGYKVILLTEEAATTEDYPIPETIERVLLPRVADCKAKNYHKRATAWEAILTSYEIDTVLYEAWDSPFLFFDACTIKWGG